MRVPQPFFRSHDGWWYVQIGKKQIKLAKGKDAEEEAYRQYFKTMADYGLAAAPTPPKQLKVSALFDHFLEWSHKHHEPDTYDWYRFYLQSFSDLYGRMQVTELKPFCVTCWLGRQDWGDSTAHGAITCVKRALNWAVDEGLVDANPLRRVKRPPMKRRETVLSAEDRKVVFASIKDQEFREYLFALQETGARPAEVRTLAREHVNLEAGLWVFPPKEHKTGKKTGRPRVLYLTPAMVELTRQLLARVPEGPLFRNTRGQQWTKDAVVQRLDHLRQRFPALGRFTAYAYRHSFCTDGLVNGVPIATMAELLGHSTTQMIEQHYGHLADRKEHLRDAAARIRP
jgi:integrase